MTVQVQLNLFLAFFFSFAVLLRELAQVKNVIFSEFFLKRFVGFGAHTHIFQISMMVFKNSMIFKKDSMTFP